MTELPWVRDPFGLEQLFFNPRSGAVSRSLPGLLGKTPDEPREPDATAIAGYFSGDRLADHTIFKGMRQVPPGHQLERVGGRLLTRPGAPSESSGNTENALRTTVKAAARNPRKVALALSGGLDSALLLGMLRALGLDSIPVYTLAVDLPRYGELQATLETARWFDIDVRVIHANGQAFVDALPRAMQSLAEPVYNLHPIAKLLVAEAMQADGIEVAITGDGADQVLSRDVSADYLPLCRALYSAAGVEIQAPFLNRHVTGCLLAHPPDPDKRQLRTLARRYNVQPHLIERPKHSRLAPALPLRELLAVDRIVALARACGQPPPDLANDRERMLWTTLLMLVESVGSPF